MPSAAPDAADASTPSHFVEASAGSMACFLVFDTSKGFNTPLVNAVATAPAAAKRASWPLVSKASRRTATEFALVEGIKVGDGKRCRVPSQIGTFPCSRAVSDAPAAPSDAPRLGGNSEGPLASNKIRSFGALITRKTLALAFKNADNETSRACADVYPKFKQALSTATLISCTSNSANAMQPPSPASEISAPTGGASTSTDITPSLYPSKSPSSSMHATWPSLSTARAEGAAPPEVGGDTRTAGGCS
mmetsp:Transcript_7584/g.24742  ORF Transcript_7584/g.24742 Transcript_7584/m.24742 type:complete len:248 (+) Transcript_7584:1723-2466(+)